MPAAQEFNRTNRDRRGGHAPSSMVGNSKQAAFHSEPKAKVFFKKLDKKRLRRENKRITEECIQQFDEDQSRYDSDYLDAYLDEQDWLDEVSSQQEEDYQRSLEDGYYDEYDYGYHEDWDHMSDAYRYSIKASRYHGLQRAADIIEQVLLETSSEHHLEMLEQAHLLIKEQL